MKEMTLIDKNVEAIKLAFLSHTPIVWLVCNEKEVANEIIIEFCKEHRGEFYTESKDAISKNTNIYTKVEKLSNLLTSPIQELAKNAQALRTLFKDRVICFNWFNGAEKNSQEYNSNTEALYKPLDIFLSIYLQIESESIYRSVAGCVENHEYIKSCIRNSIIIIASPNLPREGWYNRYIEVIHVGSIDDAEIKSILDTFKDNTKVTINDTLYRQLVVSFRGLSKREIEQVLERCLVQEFFDNNEEDKILKEVRSLKKRMLEGFPGLKWIDYDEKGIKVAGLSGITEWLNERKHLFEDTLQSIREGYSIPKGILVTGIPGTGKSLMAKQAAIDLNLPLIAMDLGDLQEGLVGKSEEHMANALRMVDSMSPCVLWIDEIEKAFSGSNSDHSDGGVMRRMLGKFLTWMQEKKSYVFVFATSNDISQFPPELFRSERFDSKFFTFMPDAEDCADIFYSITETFNDDYMKLNQNNINGFFDTSINKVFWQNTLDSVKLIHEKNKFLTGADIHAICKSLKFKLLKESNHKPPYSSKLVRKLFEEILPDFTPFGQTNMTSIAKCFHQLSKSQFICASGKDCIVPLSWNHSESEQNAASEKETSETYDECLRSCIIKAINEYSPDNNSHANQ